MPASNASQFLPLKPADLHILMALSASDLHGYAIMQQVATDTDGTVQLELGSLYRVIARMESQRLIADAKPPTGETDPRRRYYRITALGREVATAEARRLATVLRRARRLYALGPSTPGR